MNEYIDRKQLLQDIEDCVVFSARPEKVPTKEMIGARRVVERIKEAPAIDAVEVVRCKDCKHWAVLEECGHYCSHWGNMMTDTLEDDFCSNGERREL